MKSAITAVAWLLMLVAPGDQDAPSPPAGEPGSQPRRPPALDAAYGTPPAGATFDPNTRADPGLVEQKTGEEADKTYGPSLESVDAEGDVTTGYTVYDESLDMGAYGAAEGVPRFHTVRKGDTLWNISGRYLGDPYLWPKLWSYNEHITNAHWIFPGDRIRLKDPHDRGDGDGRGRTGEPTAGLEFSKTRIPVSDEPQSWVLNQTAFISADEFDAAMEVVGGAESKVMMATLDTVYMDYEDARPPIPGERLVVYTPMEPVRDVKDKDILGYVVKIVGEIDVETVAEEAAEGTIAFSLNPVERGYKVGPLRRRYKRVAPKPAQAKETGRVVATVIRTSPVQGADLHKRKRRRRNTHDLLAGERQWVIVDLGAEQGLQQGNMLEAVRKGDEYTKRRVFHIPYEEGWPRRVIARIVIVDVQPQTALGFVVEARREVERGEHVELGGGESGSAGTATPPDRPPVKARGSGKAGQGQVEGEAELRIGQ